MALGQRRRPSGPRSPARSVGCRHQIIGISCAGVDLERRLRADGGDALTPHRPAASAMLRRSRDRARGQVKYHFDAARARARHRGELASVISDGTLTSAVQTQATSLGSTLFTAGSHLGRRVVHRGAHARSGSFAGRASASPTTTPTGSPTQQPSTPAPSQTPTPAPTPNPSRIPTPAPTALPIPHRPAAIPQPTSLRSGADPHPSQIPTPAPSQVPTSHPTPQPTLQGV